MFQNTIVNEKQNLLKKLMNIILGVSKNLVNIFGVFEKFGQHIWGLRKWPYMITPVIKVSELPLGTPQVLIGFRNYRSVKKLKRIETRSIIAQGPRGS